MFCGGGGVETEDGARGGVDAERGDARGSEAERGERVDERVCAPLLEELDVFVLRHGVSP